MATDPREWRRLMEAGAAFTAYMDLDDVLRQVLPYAAESANAEWSAVILHGPEAHELVVAAAGGSAAASVRAACSRGWEQNSPACGRNMDIVAIEMDSTAISPA